MRKKIKTLFENKQQFLHQKCNKKNCNNQGIFKAPKSPNELKSYIWFCEEHNREYNKSWNYCKNMNQKQIEQHIRKDVIGWRPTWNFSYRTINLTEIQKKFTNYFNFFGNNKDKFKQKKKSEIKNALETLKISNEVSTFEEIEVKYKKLVKKYHPDKNYGNKKYEETLKKINQAFAVVKKFFLKKMSLNKSNGQSVN